MYIENLCIDLFGNDSYKKGLKIDSTFIKHYDSFQRSKNEFIHIFQVKSERSYYYYDISFLVRNNEIFTYSCDCMQFYKTHSCKHLAACLLKKHNLILKKKLTPLEISEDFLKSFYNPKKSSNIKELVGLEIELDFNHHYPMFKLYIGLNKKYVLNTESKFNSFFDSYLNNEEFEFGVNFTYDPSKHYFCEEDKKLLNFFYNNNDTYKNIIFELNKRELNFLFEKIKDKGFKLKDYGYIKGIKYEMPTSLNLDFSDNAYHLSVNELDKFLFLENFDNYVVYNSYLYVIPYEYLKIINTLHDNYIPELTFQKDNLEVFKNGLLQNIKNNIIVDESVSDIVITGTPDVSLYFDLNHDKISCNIKFDYSGNIIDYFEKNSNIVRDNDYENLIINDLNNYNFKINKSNIFIDDLDDIGYFFVEGLSELCEKYKVFTSKKMDSVNILSKSSVKSNFSIGSDGIMSYSFNTDNINVDELGDVLNSLKKNKKYYKLKNGNIVDISNNKELNELNSLFDDLEISTKNINDGNIVIPKYRALYIDSLKKNKYKSIKTDNSFDNFIDNFKKYNNINIEFDEDENKILRDYQKIGIKWLYTLYKCDLGGILADEMGLGKSLQIIGFIKQILKIKNDAKIIIVCPTSLVYNWKKEFDKFAPNLKYTTVADNKQKRLEVIKNVDNYNIFITSYGLVRNDNDEYEHIDFELCVIDEAQSIKNHQAEMTKEIKKIKAKTKIALTGTPLENSVLELWSIFDFIMPGYLGSILKFRDKYGIKDIDGESLEKLKSLNYQINPFILRRKKKDVSKDLPDKIENNIYLELPDIQKALYLNILKESQEEFNNLIKDGGFKKARFQILQLLMKLRQVCVDPNILFDNYKGESIKMEKLLETVKEYVEGGHKILIFSSFKTVIDRVNTLFNSNNISSYIISGEVKSKTRMELVDKFNSDDTNCFLITLKSGGTGLNLTSADVVIHLDIWWNPQVENQATDRAHRIGQKKKVSVIKFVTKGTIEEKIIELQNKKKILSDNLIEGKDNAELLSTLDEKEIKSLLSYGE